MYTTEAPYQNNKKDSGDDDDSKSLSQKSIIIISVVLSYTIGSIITGVGVMIWVKRRDSEKQGLLV